MAEPTAPGAKELPAFAPGMRDDGADLDVTLAWPVTDDGAEVRAGQHEPEPVGAEPAGAVDPLAEIAARLAAVEDQLARLTALVELVVDTMPGSAEGSAQ